jgi:glycosyltransferase involved in cell wall biosynthesis
MNELTKICVEAEADRRPLTRHNGIVVCVDIAESRSKNFVRELERKGFSAVHFETTTQRAALLRLRAFIGVLKRSDFVLCGAPLRSHLLWMIVARWFGRPWILDLPMDVAAWPFPTRWHCRWQVTIVSRLADYVLTLKSREYLVDKFGLRKDRVLFVESCPDRSVIEIATTAAPQFRPRPGSFVICCSGCHAPHRLERFMPIFESLLTHVANAELLFIGAPDKPCIVGSKRYAKERGLTERVHFVPIIASVVDFHATVAQCDLWVATLGDDTLQGRQELRMELLEVGLLGKPVVAARTPGLLQHEFADGEQIIFVDPADPVASALKIAKFIQQPELLGQLGESLRQRVLERFSLPKAVDHLLSTVSKHYGEREGRWPIV